MPINKRTLSRLNLNKIKSLMKIKEKVTEARINQEKKQATMQNPNYIIAELTTKGFGLGLWYGLIFVAFHYIVTAVQIGTLPHLFLPENGNIFLFGLGTLTAFGLGCGIAAGLWEHYFPSDLIIISEDIHEHHQDKNVPRRIFNLAVFTLRFLPKVMHYLKSNSHLSLLEEHVPFNQKELEELDRILGELKGDVPLTPVSMSARDDGYDDTVPFLARGHYFDYGSGFERDVPNDTGATQIDLGFVESMPSKKVGLS